MCVWESEREGRGTEEGVGLGRTAAWSMELHAAATHVLSRQVSFVVSQVVGSWVRARRHLVGGRGHGGARPLGVPPVQLLPFDLHRRRLNPDADTRISDNVSR